MDYGSIQAATYLIGGWRDGYTNCNLRTFGNCNVPRKQSSAPGCSVPDSGLPGPRIDHLHEMVRFYDYWLKGIDNGIMAEPPIAIYVQGYDRPEASRPVTGDPGATRPPSRPRVDRENAFLGQDRFNRRGPSDAGTAGGGDPPGRRHGLGMFSAGSPHVLPGDQRAEEAYSAVFTGAALAEPLEILGRPRLRFQVASDAEVITFAARLCEVAPDGSSALITKGVLNATHRESHSDPRHWFRVTCTS